MTDPMRAALTAAAARFREDEARHATTATTAPSTPRSLTPEGFAAIRAAADKAARARELAERCEAALAAPPTLEDRLRDLLADFISAEPDDLDGRAHPEREPDPYARHTNAAARMIAAAAAMLDGEHDHAMMALARGAGLYMASQFTTAEATTTEAMLLSGAAAQLALELQTQRSQTRQ